MRPRVTTRLALFLIALLGVIAAPAAAHAQGQYGNIHGIVTDQSDAALPGVTVTLSSPALLVEQTKVSDTAGQYRFDQLPVGIYKLTLELTGFQTLVREGLQLPAGFNATVNIQLHIGTVEETVTVSGASPVVDLTSATTSVSVPAAVLADRLPVTRVMPAVLAVAPGVQSGAPDLGGGNVGTATFVAYGLSGQSTPLIEGINTRRSSIQVETNYDFTAIEDFQITTFGGDAEKALPGVGLNAVIKSGGNLFSGRHEASVEDSKLEGNNLTPLIRSQGTTNPQLILTALDVTDSVGGPIQKNKWWFFGAYHLNRTRRTALGYLLPDHTPGNSYVRQQNFTFKSTLQLTPKYKLIGFYTKYPQIFPDRNASSTTPYYSTVRFSEPAAEYKFELQGMPTAHIFYNILAGHHGYHANYYAKPDQGRPNSIDQATNINAGPTLGQDRRTRQSPQVGGSLSYLPDRSILGRHEIKVGTTWMFQFTGTNEPYGNHGNYQLVFNQGVPVQIKVYNYPLASNLQKLTEGGAFTQDTWRLGQRLTMNVGLRFDSFHSWVPEQTKPAGPFGTPWDLSVSPARGSQLTQPRVDAGTWRNLAARVGMVWDITGSGKTVIKGSFGRYNNTPGDDYAAAYNLNVATITTYKWSGPCGPQAQTNGLWDANGYNCDYVPGTVNLDPNGGDYLSIAGGANGGPAKLPNTAVNPDLKEQFTREYQLFVEKELMPNLAMRAGVSYAQNLNLWQQVPYLIPYGAWNLPRTVYDAGPNVTPSLTNTAGNAITIYDLDPAYRAGQFSQTRYINRPANYADTFRTYEVTMTKRATGRWNAIVSYSVTENHQFVNGVPTNPNLEYFNLDTSAPWQARVSGSYDLPWQFDVSAQLTVQNGLLGARTSTYNLPNSGSLALRVEDMTTKGPARENLNLRIARELRTGKQRYRFSAEILNATNNSSAYAVTLSSGQQYGRITTISTPRVARLGMSFSF
ncbi:MAG TPA: carboxypeptidase regulatory-like domain-containing protein [Vicinamibacterales bacterium]|nr:carboxypeptidase regulatory-like domain-containing protein [Vicinamibacterales bacterium]